MYRKTHKTNLKMTIKKKCVRAPSSHLAPLPSIGRKREGEEDVRGEGKNSCEMERQRERRLTAGRPE